MAKLLSRLRPWLVARIRRSRFLPVGMPDKRADSDRLGRPVRHSILVHFPNGADALYQLRPWLPALEALDRTHPVVLVFRDSRTAALVRAETDLDCLTLANYGQLDAILSLSKVKLALYVNHDPINFECLRFTSLTHVYLGHGDSDKGVSVSNQVKAYDYCFVAGDAALERTATAIMGYDAESRLVPIGQPQLDGPRPEPRPDPLRQTVLYAPTWESSQPSLSYGSVADYGERIVAALSSRYRVIYRPHPLTGVIDPAYAAADHRLRELAERVDTDTDLAQSFADADLLITDVSGVIMNWLPTGKPVLVTRPSVPVPASALLDILPIVGRDDDPAALVAEHLAQDACATERQAMTEYYLGDVTPGAATARFVEACDRLIKERDECWADHQRRGALGP